MGNSRRLVAVSAGAGASWLCYVFVAHFVVARRCVPGGPWEGDRYWPVLSIYILPACLAIGGGVFGLILGLRTREAHTNEASGHIPWLEIVLLAPANILLVYQALRLDLGLVFSPMYWSVSVIASAAAYSFTGFRRLFPVIGMAAGAVVHFWLPHQMLQNLPGGVIPRLLVLSVWPLSGAVSLWIAARVNSSGCRTCPP